MENKQYCITHWNKETPQCDIQVAVGLLLYIIHRHVRCYLDLKKEKNIKNSQSTCE